MPQSESVREASQGQSERNLGDHSREYHRFFLIFKSKKSDTQVRRVNTFHILQPMHKGPSYFKLCMKGPLRFPNF
jgi:hypothetical protein